jgi:callose synthase
VAKRDDGTIDRSKDITQLQEFYQSYRKKNNVDDEEEMQFRESEQNLDEYV